jgi:hypothetical protein
MARNFVMKHLADVALVYGLPAFFADIEVFRFALQADCRPCGP